MSKYYYLISGLPNIALDDSKLAYSVCEFRTEIEDMLSSKDKKLIDFFYLKYDNINLLRGFSLKTFPKPLTVKEEKYYLQKYKEGDEEAKQILIERNLRLVAHVAKKYQHPDEDADDLISIGTVGLIKAVLTFDHTKNNRLATYAARCIDNELLMMLRLKKKTSKEVSLYEPIGMDKEGNEICLVDIVEGKNTDLAEMINKKQEIREMYHYMAQLNERERQILSLRYGILGQKETTQREIAQKLGISRSYVSRIEKNALSKLRSCFREKGKTGIRESR